MNLQNDIKPNQTKSHSLNHSAEEIAIFLQCYYSSDFPKKQNAEVKRCLFLLLSQKNTFTGWVARRAVEYWYLLFSNEHSDKIARP